HAGEAKLPLGADIYDVAGETDNETLQTIAKVFQRVDKLTDGLLSHDLIQIAIIYDETLPIHRDSRSLASADGNLLRLSLPRINQRAAELGINRDVLLDQVIAHELAHYIDSLLGGETGTLAQEHFVFSTENTDSGTYWGEVHTVFDRKTGEPVTLPHAYAGVNPSEFTAVVLEQALQSSGEGAYVRSELDESIAKFRDLVFETAAAKAKKLAEE